MRKQSVINLKVKTNNYFEIEKVFWEADREQITTGQYYHIYVQLHQHLLKQNV